MTDETPNGNNEKKTFNRRARTIWATIALVTVAFYICMFFVPNSFEWFKLYAICTVTAAGIIVGGISVTDAITSWKK